MEETHFPNTETRDPGLFGCAGDVVDTHRFSRYPTTLTSQRSQEDDLRLVERLTNDEYKLVDGVLASDVLSKDWSQTWARVADDRLVLAGAHLAAAEVLAEACPRCGWDPLGRSVISRAYYSMFCAVRAVLAFAYNGDHKDHKKLPDVLGKTSSLGPTDVRHLVVRALRKSREFRNDADYSAYFPGRIESHASFALSSARYVMEVCAGWVGQIKKERKLS